MAINVNHNINFKGVASFETTFNSLFSKLESINTKISNKLDSVGTKFEKASTKLNSAMATSRGAKIEAGVDKSIVTSGKRVDSSVNTDFKNLAKDTSNSFKELSKDVGGSFRKINQDFSDSMRNIRTSYKDTLVEQKMRNNISMADIFTKFGVATTIFGVARKSAESGSIVGSGDQSLNVGALNSADFVQNYQSQMLLNKQQVKNSVAEGIGGTAFAASLFSRNPVLMGLGGLAEIGSSVYSYYNNKGTQQDIAGNQFKLQQDENAWRLKNTFGIGSLSSGKVDINGKSYNTDLSDLQSSMLGNKGLAPYASYAPSFMFGANRAELQNEGSIGKSTALMGALARQTGVSEQNLPQLIGNVTTLAQSTNQSSANIMNKLLDSWNKYGGDIAKNTGQTLAVMQNYHMNFEQANDLVSRYQYNPVALQNITNARNTTPMNKWVASAIGKIAGLSDKEVSSGQLDGRHLMVYRKAQSSVTNGLPGNPDPKFVLYDMFAQLRGQNLNADSYGVMPKIKGKELPDLDKSLANPPANVSAFSDFVQKALQGADIGVNSLVVQKMEVMSHSMLNPEAFRTAVEASAKHEYASKHSGSGTGYRY